MPTGYTGTLYNGEEKQSFEDFALDCARAFGALVMLRDSPSEEIPDEFEPATYHRDALAKAEAERKELIGLSDEEADRRAQAEFDGAVAEREKAKAERDARLRRYQAMLDRVEDWEPPTPDHEGLKEFMVDQLERSIDFDCGPLYGDEPARLTGPDWRAEALTRNGRDLVYHRRHWQEEQERVAGRNAWLRDLRSSLTPSTPTDAGQPQGGPHAD